MSVRNTQPTKSTLGFLAMMGMVIGLPGPALAIPPGPPDLPATQTEMTAQHDMIKQDLSDAQTAIQTELGNIDAQLGDVATTSEMSAQHNMIKQDLSDAQTAIQTDIAEVKALVETLATLCGAGTAGQRFVTSGDSTEVCDNTTGLSWVQAPDTTTRNHEDALTYCAGLDLSNGQTYRLPEVKELVSLIDYSQSSPALPAGHPFSNVQSAIYLSASTFAFDPAVAWIVSVDLGGVGTSFKSAADFVWCARGDS